LHQSKQVLAHTSNYAAFSRLTTFEDGDIESFLAFFELQRRRAMDQINKHKQNDHNARGTNGRTVAPPAKTPAVQILTISNVPSDILEAINELAARQDRSRSSFIRRELQRTVAEYQAKEALSKSR
jgi:hypothetical protein